MATIDDYNIVVGGVSLNNSWRKTTTGITIVRDSQGFNKVAGIEFVIEADTEAQLADRLEQTAREFNKRDAPCYGYRTTDADRIFDWSTGDGESQEITCAVTMLPQEEETKFSYYLYMEISASLVIKSPPGGGGPNRPVEVIDGLVGNVMEIVETHETGETTTIVASGLFATLLQPTTKGPFTVTTITLDATTGFIKCTLTGAPAGVVAGDYATLVGTALYNGQWTVVDVGADYLVLDYTFIANDTSGGTINCGVISQAKDLFETAKPGILSILGAGANGLTVVHRTGQDVGDGTYEFTISLQEQDFVPGGIGDGDTQLVRSAQMRIVTQGSQNFETDAALSAYGSGAYGILIAEGTVVLNRESAQFVDDLEGLWDSTIRADVLARIIARAGATSITVTVEDISIDVTTPQISFTIACVDQNFTNAMVLERVTTKSITDEPWIFSKGNGLHGIQFEAAPPIAVITRVFTRVGVGNVDLSAIAAPVEAGFSFHLQNATDEERGPIKAGELSNVYMQKRIETWLRYKTS